MVKKNETRQARDEKRLAISGGVIGVEVSVDPPGVTIRDPKGGVLIDEKPGTLSYAGVPDLGCWPLISWWMFSGKPKRWITPKVVNSTVKGDSINLSLGMKKGDETTRLVYQLEEPEILRCSIEVLAPPENCRIMQSFSASGDDRFFGFGERMNSAEQQGRIVPVWTEEGAVGFGSTLGSMLKNKPWHPFPKGPLTTYIPMPWFISNRGYGFLVDGDPMTEFDVAANKPDTWTVTHWSGRMSWLFFYGPDPKDIIERFTGRVGRYTLPKPWVFAPWNDAVSGPDRLEKVASTCREKKIPSSAIWTEDWQGGQRKPLGNYLIFPVKFKPDRSLYPRIEEHAKDLHDRGFRWFSYFLPYVYNKSDLYEEAVAKDYLVKDKKGDPYPIHVLFDTYGQVDLTNPEAVDWIKGIWKRCLDLGFDGWMHDFGEYTPPDSVFHNGKTGWEMHNRYPLLWQRTVREFFDEHRPDGDYCFFCRSGYVGSQKHTPVIWSGDSNTDWEVSDGLPSNIPAAISAGLGGLPVWACDIAGYMSPTLETSTRELFWRWTQFGAMCPVMRTHHGTNMFWNHHFDHDDVTLEFYAGYARFHTALFPLFYSLAKEATENGLPVMRHLMLHYPDDPATYGENLSFMLGPNVLVAPVVEKGARSRNVYLPEGDWVDYWTGEAYKGGERHLVPAPLDRIPVFIKTPSMLVTFDAPVDTLVENVKPPLVGWDEANSSMRLTLFGQGEARATLWDGTEIYMILDGKPVKLKSRRGKTAGPREDRLSPMVRGGLSSIKGAEVRFELLDKKDILVGKGRVNGPVERVYTIAFR